MKKFIKKEYQLYSSKINSTEPLPVMVMLSDLHNTSFGIDNEHLLQEIALLQPDVILIGGDMIIGKEGHSVETASRLIQRLSSIAPIFHALGNHEYRMKYHPDEMTEEYRMYEQTLRKENVVILDNASAGIDINGTRFEVHGLSIPRKYYSKKKRERLSAQDMAQMIGNPANDAYEILLAHNPRYAQTYFAWGADLTLCGHYHGGMMRLEDRGVISPDFTLFPKYGYGRFEETGKTVLVSAGMGEHTIPFRIFNPRELLVLRFYPLEGK